MYIRGEINLDKLINRGLVIGKDCQIQPDVFIDPSHCWHIFIGDEVKIGHGVKILAHDASTKSRLGLTKIANTTIGSRSYIGTESIILPGVSIGEDVIIGAGSVVYSNIPSSSIATGNPAKVISSLELYLLTEQSQMNKGNSFDESYTLRSSSFNIDKKRELIEACHKNGKAYVC